MIPILLDPCARFLHGKQANVTSQNGEDGLLAAIFDAIGIRNHWCFEVGASDGVELSNTFALRQQCWRAVLIEADAAKFAKLQVFIGGAVLVHERIGPDSLDRILRDADAPQDIDLGVIDIDGPDLEVWKGLKDFRPRVVCIEYNQKGDGMLGPPFNAWQAGWETVAKFARENGYVPMVRTLCNLICVDKGVADGTKGKAS